MSEKVAYIAGPMTGLPYFNEEAFHEAERALRAEGFEVFNPCTSVKLNYGDDFFARCPNGTVEEAKAAGFDLREQFARDLSFICLRATHIVMLPGWGRSEGARAEHAVALVVGVEHRYLP